MSFPKEFLESLPQYPTLSARQQDVFLCVFGKGSEWTNHKRAQELSVAESTVRSSLTGIYHKFHVQSGGGHGKENWLRAELGKKFQRWQGQGAIAIELVSGEKDIDALVNKTRKQIRSFVQQKCGTMRVLDMNQPIGLGDIYTNVNILEKTTASNRYDIEELVQACKIDGLVAFDRWGFGKIKEERIPGIEAVKRHDRLMVLGKPGAGKTTFLKYLAIQSSQGTTETGNLYTDYVPLFVTLKSFAEREPPLSLLDYLADVAHLETTDLNTILEQGRGLVLLDGLDEVLEVHSKKVNQSIEAFSGQYEGNTIVVTCRIAAKKYIFQSFTEVEVADFDETQVHSFVEKWFWSREKPQKAEKFLDRLTHHDGVKELANSPLLLTLLCLIFEEKNKFYDNRSELYSEGVQLLLAKWDDSRDVERDEIYKNLSVKRRQDLLGKLALDLFTEGRYFFKPKQAADIIEAYIANLPNVESNSKTVDDSYYILRAIQAQHGLLVERASNIYSFSHLTFHEYFAAKEAVDSSRDQLLAQHLFDERWREILLLAVGIARQSDSILLAMKQNIERKIISNSAIQAFFSWNSRKVTGIKFNFQVSLVRGFYISLVLNLARVSAVALNLDSAYGLSSSFSLASDLALDLGRARASALDLALDLELNRALARAIARDGNLDRAIKLTQKLSLVELTHRLKEMNSALPHVDSSAAYQAWWKKNGQSWIQDLQNTIIEYRNMGHPWNFTTEDARLLEQYLKATKLLVDCLNSDCYVSREVRQEIEDTLFLPQVELDRYYADRPELQKDRR